MNNSIFESIKHFDEEENEYWFARELQKALEYKRWDKFTSVIDSAKTTCKNSNLVIKNHFSHLGKMVEIGSKTSRRIDQTEEKLKKDDIKGENNANMIHYNMGKDIRKFIEKQGGTMPEKFPTPNKSLKELEKERKFLNNK